MIVCFNAETQTDMLLLICPGKFANPTFALMGKLLHIEAISYARLTSSMMRLVDRMSLSILTILLHTITRVISTYWE